MSNPFKSNIACNHINVFCCVSERKTQLKIAIENTTQNCQTSREIDEFYLQIVGCLKIVRSDPSKVGQKYLSPPHRTSPQYNILVYICLYTVYKLYALSDQIIP